MWKLQSIAIDCRPAPGTLFGLVVASPCLAGTLLHDNANAASFTWRAIHACPFDPGERFEEGAFSCPGSLSFYPQAGLLVKSRSHLRCHFDSWRATVRLLAGYIDLRGSESKSACQSLERTS
ncbi:MAG: hypothetical protein CMJ70_27815 [Planctomycetaceae bacterium]|nr:hypothetical protein [Planctomycetaceae bacterium]